MGQSAIVADEIRLTQPPGREVVGKATASIRGHVTRGDGRPLARVLVQLLNDEPSTGPPIPTMTDEAGGYKLDKLLPGRYRVRASKVGYAALEFNQRRPFERGDVIFLDTGEQRDRVDIALVRHGAVEGRIVDENGDPVDGVSVTALQIRFKGGRRQLVAVPGSVVPRRTNELGRYRVYGLPPGEYFVSADIGKVGTEDLPGYATTYFPGTPAPGEARAVRVGLAEDVTNVDFPLVPIGTARIAGTTVTSAGEPFQGGIQMRPSRRSGAIAGDEVGARTLPDGSFEFPNVPPGEYVLYAFRNVETAWTYVTVDGRDVTGVAIQTLPGSTITGRVTFEGPDIPAPQDVELTPVPADPDLTPFVGGPDRADIHDDWTFEITHVSGPRRLRVRRPPSGWNLKTILLNGSDATDAVLSLGTPAQSLKNVEIVLTRQQTHIAGRVTDDQGRAIGGCAAIAFAVDADQWGDDSRFLATTRSARDGAFDIRGLPAGDYFVTVADRVREDDEWRDPDVLNALARSAKRVTLIEGPTAEINFQLSSLNSQGSGGCGR
jgi:hypothetical protein